MSPAALFASRKMRLTQNTATGVLQIAVGASISHEVSSRRGAAAGNRGEQG
jgi:hypothetical protein